MGRARAQIRRPLDSRAQVSISIVDTNGAVLGLVRAPDAPIFGTDVSLQKARTATFFSGSAAGAELSANASAAVRHFVPAMRGFQLGRPSGRGRGCPDVENTVVRGILNKKRSHTTQNCTAQ